MGRRREATVEFVKSGKAAEFVCAAGVLSHCVGDACQPLHFSYMFNGDPDNAEVVTHKNRQGKTVTVTTTSRTSTRSNFRT
jgi:hypothetical protein